MSAVTRRALVEAVGFTGLSGIAAATFGKPETLTPTAHPLSSDAALVALAQQHTLAQQSLTALIHASGVRHGADLPATVWHQERAAIQLGLDVEERMAGLSASSLRGLCAKARVIRAQFGYTGEPDPEHALLWSLTGDLLQLASGDQAVDRVPA